MTGGTSWVFGLRRYSEFLCLPVMIDEITSLLGGDFLITNA